MRNMRLTALFLCFFVGISSLSAAGRGGGGVRGGLRGKGRGFVDKRREKEEKRRETMQNMGRMQQLLRIWEKAGPLDPEHFRMAAKTLELTEEKTEKIIAGVEKFNTADKLKQEEVTKRYAILNDNASKARQVGNGDLYQKIAGQIGLLANLAAADRDRRYQILQRANLSLVTPITKRKQWPAAYLCSVAVSNLKRVILDEKQTKQAYERCYKKSAAISKAMTFASQRIMRIDIEAMIRDEILTEEQRKKMLGIGGKDSKGKEGRFGDRDPDAKQPEFPKPGTPEADPKTGDKTKDKVGGWE